MECACGEHALSNVFKEAGKNVRCSDLVVRCDGIEQLDFLQCNEKVHDTDIVTNPTYKYALDFVNHTIDLVDDGRYVCMFLKLQFLKEKNEDYFIMNFLQNVYGFPLQELGVV